MNQRGFIQLPILAWGAIAAGAVILALSIGLKVQTSRLETCQVEFKSFKLETKRIGEAAEKSAREQEARDKKLKERTDADHKTTVARLNADLKRLRDDHASSSLVPAPAPGAASPQRACFDRGQLGVALSGFERGVEGLIGEGANAVAGLDAAKSWAQAQ
jgi:hypothetical protein